MTQFRRLKVDSQKCHTRQHHSRKTISKRKMPKPKKKPRANILLATLNMKGQASTNLGNSITSKWSALQSVMRDKKFGILSRNSPDNRT
jgi:hypothetical protein